MKWSSTTSLGLVAAVAYAAPAADNASRDMTGSPPPGCVADHPGAFEISVKPTVSKRDIQKRDCNAPGALVLTLSGGQIKDAQGRTGYVADNGQVQFDDPPQLGSLATGGFSLCPNNTVALGSSTLFSQCRSGDFYNLYSDNNADQCEPIHMVAMPCGASGPQAAAAVVTQIADGQPQAPTGVAPPPQAEVANSPVTQIADGQPQAPAPTDRPGGSPVAQVAQVPNGSSTDQAGEPPVTDVSDVQSEAPPSASIPAGGSPVANFAPPGAGQPAQGSNATSGASAPQAGETQAAFGTGSSGGGSTTSPSSPAAPSNGVSSSGFKTLPGAKAALAIALLGFIAL